MISTPCGGNVSFWIWLGVCFVTSNLDYSLQATFAMKIHNFLLPAVVVTACGTVSANAVVLSAWTFETNTPADVTNSATGPSVVAESGLFTTGFTAVGVHSSANTDWTTPAGNGSANSYSANEWTVGSYFQFATASTGYEGITITFDQTGSNTGPRDFKLQYSTDGSAFTDFTGGAYTVINGGWSSGTPVNTTSFSFDLSAITALNNDASIWFRLVDTSTVAVNGGAVATTGTGRIDNVVISGVPEPSGAAIIGSIGVLGLLRRRR